MAQHQIFTELGCFDTRLTRQYDHVLANLIGSTYIGIMRYCFAHYMTTLNATFTLIDNAFLVIYQSAKSTQALVLTPLTKLLKTLSRAGGETAQIAAVSCRCSIFLLSWLNAEPNY